MEMFTIQLEDGNYFKLEYENGNVTTNTNMSIDEAASEFWNNVMERTANYVAQQNTNALLAKPELLAAVTIALGGEDNTVAQTAINAITGFVRNS